MIEVSFCIPVMNRLNDLKITLSKNLKDNLDDKDIVEFIVVSFDHDNTTRNWLYDNFADELQSGYLKFYQSNVLESWHFGKAKNIFKQFMLGKIYSSLDADNYTGYRCGKFISNIFKSTNYKCIIHHYCGNWGDGTCGRISVSREDYINVGYDDKFLPRQWDELDFILSVLTKYRSHIFYCHKGNNVFTKSEPLKRFIFDSNFGIHSVELNDNLDTATPKMLGYAVSTNANDYVENNNLLRFSSKFNHLLSFIKNSQDSNLISLYKSEIRELQISNIDLLDISHLEDSVLHLVSESKPTINSNSFILVSCIKDGNNLDGWFTHYRKLGVTTFLIIDDNSLTPISNQNYGSDIFVWKPKVGNFNTCKVFWIEILLRKYAIGKWVLTLDADEYLQHECDDKIYNNLFEWLNSKKAIKLAEYFPAINLDMLPSKKSYFKIKKNYKLDIADFDSFQFRKTNANSYYMNHHISRWAYGVFTHICYKIDIRYRINRSFDCIRKFPCFIMKKNIRLNQGFHDLVINGVPRTSLELCRDDLMIIKHYKLYDEYIKSKDLSNFNYDSYHSKTAMYLKRLNRDFCYLIVNATINPFVMKWISLDHFKRLLRAHFNEK